VAAISAVTQVSKNRNFNEGGESGILDKLAAYDKTFPLYDALVFVPPVENISNTKIFLASKTPDVQVEKLIHLGMGIFWKASVHSWQGGRTEPRIELGKYSEAIRLWLRSEAPFPNHVYLIINFISPDMAFQINMFPPSGRTRRNNILFWDITRRLSIIQRS
jgi:hypothetical protein